MMAFKIMKIYISNYDIRFQVCFSFGINFFLYYFFKINKYMILLLYFNFNKKFEAFFEIIDHN